MTNSKHTPKITESRKEYNKPFLDKLRADGYFKNYNSRPEYKEKMRKLWHLRKNKPTERIKINARHKAKIALRSGIIIKLPCYCGEIKAEMHHNDYSKPLEVIWLCRKCHENIHHKKAQVQ